MLGAAIFFRGNFSNSERVLKNSKNAFVKPFIRQSSPVTKMNEQTRILEKKESIEKSIEDVMSRLGKSIQSKFNSNGNLVSMDGAIQKNYFRDDFFNPMNKDKIKLRALNVLEELSLFMGLNDQYPMVLTQISPGRVTAQAFFEQKFGELIMTPRGKMSLRFGPSGEVIGMDSTYSPSVSIKNEFSLDEDQAAQYALKSAQYSDSKISGSVQVVMNRKILWVSDFTSKNPSANKAYEFQIAGKQIVIDGQSGKVLFHKNQRHYFH